MTESIVHSPSRARQAMAFVGWIALCFTASAGAVFVTIDGWYAALNKPSWNPPAWVFGPVWTTLYVMMATAAWLVWRKGGWRAQWRALLLFVIQLMLNALWTPLFFGLHQPGLAFAEIVMLWIVLAVTSLRFWSVTRVSGLLLFPYLAWVTFAAVLNFEIWQLNQ